MTANRYYRRLQVVSGLAAVAFGAIAVTGFVLAPASAQPTSFTLTAAANEASVELDAASFPLLAPQVAYLSPGTAQAELDSFGGSTAFAGAPFLGQTVEGIGGLVSGLGSGVLPPVPQTLPGYISTVSPSDPSETESQGPYTLIANSTQDTSSATAGIGLVSGQPQLLATSATASSTLNPDGSLQATAHSVTQPFALGSLVQLGTVQATATMSVDANGNVTKTSSLDLGTLSIAGIKFGLDQSGFELLGGLLPVPTTVAALNKSLSALGFEINLISSSQTATSITSAGLQIAEKQTVPVEGVTTVIITLGQATATLQDQAEAPQTSSGTGDALSTPDSSATQSIPTNISPAAPIITPTSTNASSSPPPSAPSAAPSQLLTVTRIKGQLGPDAIRWYGLLALAALALTLTSRLANVIAIRPRRRP